MLQDEILCAQNKDTEALLKLINKFNPLLKKYCKVLNYEDAFNDLQMHLIEIIKKIPLENLKSVEDPYIINYITTSIKNYSIKLLKKKINEKKTIPISTMSENDNLYYIEKILFVYDTYFKMDYDFLSKILTSKEIKVLIYRYIYGFTLKEISQIQNVSISAVSQLNKNALKKLQKYIKKEDFL